MLVQTTKNSTVQWTLTVHLILFAACKVPSVFVAPFSVVRGVVILERSFTECFGGFRKLGEFAGICADLLLFDFSCRQ